MTASIWNLRRRIEPVADRINRLTRPIPSWVIYALAFLPPLLLFHAAFTGALGVDPVKPLERQLGKYGIQTFIVTLSITPLRQFAGINLIKFRRAFGLVTFFYILTHLLVWLILDVQILSEVWADIVKRPYITVGMAAFALLVPLALTSSDAAIRRLGALRWNRLHKLTYPAALLGASHYVMQAKGFRIEPLAYLALIVGLVALRYVPRRPRRRV